jgi:hypothetical protein
MGPHVGPKVGQRTAGRPTLTTRTQVTVKIELMTKEKLVAEAMRRRPAGKKQVQIGRVIDWLAQNYLNLK